MVILMAAPAFAADDLKITARAEPDRLPPGEAFRLIITVEGEGIESLPEPNVPRLKNFEIVGKSSSQQVSIVNLSMKVSKSTVYSVVASKEGTFEIPSISVTKDGKIYKTDPIKITVDPKAPVPSGPRTARRRGPSLFPDFDKLFRDEPFSSGQKIEKDDLFTTMEVDKLDAVPFEQVTATFSFYRAVDLWGKPGFEKPDFEGFWVEELQYPDGEKEQTTVEEVNGKKYHVTRMRYALIPLSVGPKVVDSAALSVSVDPWSQRLRLTTNPIPITVRPFPDKGKPADFTNMVGDYKVTSALKPDNARVNDSVTLTVTITGEGYLKPVDAPAKPVIDGVEVYDPKVTDDIDKSGGVIRSTRVIEFPLIPRAEGEKTVPPMTFVWYNPKTKEYVRHETKPMKLDVAPSLAPAPSATPQERGDVERMAGDIRYIKPNHDVLEDWGAPLHRSAWIWLFVLLPAPVLAAGWVVAARRRRLATDPAYARYVNAAKNANMRLDAAKNAKDQRDFFAVLDQALRGYLADRWNVPAPSVTREMVRERFSDNGAGLAGSIVDLLDAVEHARYAPFSSEDMAARLDKARRIIDTMEKMG